MVRLPYLLGAAVFALACSSRPPVEAASVPPSVETAALPSGPPRDGLLVSNVCSSNSDSYQLHARIDAESIGGDRPPATRVVWTIACREQVCRGTKVELDAWLAKGKLEPGSVAPLEGLELIEGAASGFVVRWGASTFRVDVSRSEVVFEESGRVRQHGTAPCSESGVPWPTGAR